MRKAIIAGIDRQDLVNRVLAGQSSIADSVIPPISALFSPNTTKYPFNPDQARSILDADGWVDGLGWHPRQERPTSEPEVSEHQR